MTLDTLAPTPEWLKKHEHQQAGTDQKTQISAYRKLSEAEKALNRGDITDEQHDAAKRLYRIYAGGIMGADVRQDDDMPGTPYDPDYPAREAMASDVEYARRCVSSPRIWDALIRFVIEEEPLSSIGVTYFQTSTRAISKAVGLTLVREGLDACAWAWGISQHQRSRDQRSA